MTEWVKPSQVSRICLLISLLVRPDYFAAGSVSGMYIYLNEAYWSRWFIRYCDTDQGYPVFEDDDFMQRIVGITQHKTDSQSIKTLAEGKIINTGIFINENHLLTSFNPFRRMMNEVPRRVMFIHYYKANWVNLKQGIHKGFVIDKEQFSCARQVVPLQPKEIIEEQWHGVKHTHSPVHDLMLIKLVRKVKFVTKYYNVTRDRYGDDAVVLGPQLTELADEHEDLPDTIKYVSLGMMDYNSIYNFSHLHTVTINTNEGIIENCDEWFPRSWGYFICVVNTEDYIAIGSGAFLFGNDKVFGVGSFTLRKGKKSIFVFTDIRPYRKLIFLPCDYNSNSFGKL